MAFPFHTMELSKVQRLYDACDAVFSSAEETQIGWLQDLLDGLEAEDVGIDEGKVGGERSSEEDEDEMSPKSRLLWPRAFERITYVHIHECADFPICVFCFSAGARLPLHDHPEMVVLSKLLYGSMRLRPYDWVTEPCYGPKKCGLAKLVADDEVRDAPCKTSVLFPRSGGNIHALTAVTPCALLDVLAPRYAEQHGRPSTYFSEIPLPSLPGFAILEETYLPEDFRVAGAPYLGPELIPIDMDELEMDDYN